MEDRIRSISRTSGSAEAAREALESAKINVKALLRGEAFALALAVELGGMAERLRQIDDDLQMLSYNPEGPDNEVRSYRLAHGGREPAPQAAKEQLEAIEARGRAAA